MKKYRILWSRSDYGTIVIEAEDEEKARELFEMGEYDECDLNIKNGQIDVESVELCADTK